MFRNGQELSGEYVTTLPFVPQDFIAVQSTSNCSESISSQNRCSHISPTLLEARVFLNANKIL